MAINTKGFTLVEVIMAVAILMILTAITFISFRTSQSIFIKGNIQIDIQREARMALAKMAKELRQARRGGLTVFPDSVSFSLVDYTIDDDSDNPRITYSYDVSSRTTWRTCSHPVTNEIMVRNVANVMPIFTLPLGDTSLVKISITIDKQEASLQRGTIRLESEVSLRNI